MSNKIFITDVQFYSMVDLRWLIFEKSAKKVVKMSY